MRSVRRVASIWVVMLVGLLLVVPALASPKTAKPKKEVKSERFMDLSADEVDEILEAASHLPPHDRLERLSRHFLGTPYVVGPLGEGPGHAKDPDPLFRLDQVDCLTLLESLWGMMQATTLDETMKRAQAVRYRNGIVSYIMRNHFIWLQWLPRNEAAGYMVDVTRQIGGEATLRQTKILKSAAQCGGQWKTFCAELAEELPREAVQRDIIPLDWTLTHWRDIPHGVFAFFVLNERSWLPYRIKHAGLILHDAKGRPFLRHASTVHRRVLDVPLLRYLKMLKTKSVKWPATGLILLRPVADVPLVETVPSVEQVEELPASP